MVAVFITMQILIFYWPSSHVLEFIRGLSEEKKINVDKTGFVIVLFANNSYFKVKFLFFLKILLRGNEEMKILNGISAIILLQMACQM